MDMSVDCSQHGPLRTFAKARGFDNVKDFIENASEKLVSKLIIAEIQYQQLNEIISEFKRFTDLAD